jgi:two-component system, cell cycle sensor histidine kinase and response regulator CckA
MVYQPLILVVDDEEFIRKLSTRILSMHGYDVIQAENGKQAVGIYEHSWGLIDLVLLDIRMPDISGVETFRRMVAINPAARIVLCSGYGEYEFPAENGCFFVQKPFTVKGLTDSVKRVLDLSKAEIIMNNEKVDFRDFLEEIY